MQPKFMKRWRNWLFLGLTILLWPMSWAEDSTPSASSTPPPKSKRYPVDVSRYDLATQDDLRFAYFLEELLDGDQPERSGILTDLAAQVGPWITNFIDAPRIASVVNTGLQVSGQPPLQSVDLLVEDCAKILGVPKPTIYIRNSPLTISYVVSISDHDFLVLTSGLLRLFEDSPEELRFIVGRELGHIKCRHTKIKRAAYGLLSAIQSINLSAVPTEYQLVLPTLAFGRLFTWARESEISADRAGLLCCQDPQIAYDALMRLLHGLNAKSSWIDPTQPTFDAEKVQRDFQQWQNEPLVKFVSHFQRFSLESPFIPERLAALTMWAESPDYERVLNNSAPAEPKLAVVKAVQVSGLGTANTPLQVYFKGSDYRQSFLRSQTGNSNGKIRWESFKTPVECGDGQPMYFEVWNDLFPYDKLLGGFVVYPRQDAAKYTVSFDWDWNTRSGISTPVVVELDIDFIPRSK